MLVSKISILKVVLRALTFFETVYPLNDELHIVIVISFACRTWNSIITLARSLVLLFIVQDSHSQSLPLGALTSFRGDYLLSLTTSLDLCSRARRSVSITPIRYLVWFLLQSTRSSPCAWLHSYKYILVHTYEYSTVQYMYGVYACILILHPIYIQFTVFDTVTIVG